MQLPLPRAKQEFMAATQGLISFLQQVAGYAVTGLTEEDVFIIFFGIGNNGKSTFLEILQRMMGDYGQTAETTTFGMTPSPMISQH